MQYGEGQQRMRCKNMKRGLQVLGDKWAHSGQLTSDRCLIFSRHLATEMIPAIAIISRLLCLQGTRGLFKYFPKNALFSSCRNMKSAVDVPSSSQVIVSCSHFALFAWTVTCRYFALKFTASKHAYLCAHPCCFCCICVAFCCCWWICRKCGGPLDIWRASQLRTGCLSILIFLTPLAEVTLYSFF